MTGLGEELYPLYASIMSSPRVQPLLRYVAVMVFTPEVTWRLHETLTSLVKDTSISMIYGSSLEKDVLTRILNFSLR